MQVLRKKGVMAVLTLEYHGRVRKDGEIELPKRLRREVVQAFAGHGIEVIFRRKKKRRSNSQNAYYWVVIVPAVLNAFIDLGNDIQDNGENRQAVHEYLRDKFLDNHIEVADAHGVAHRMRPSTTRLSTIEMEEYNERIRRWAAEMLNIVIPLPNEQMEMF